MKKPLGRLAGAVLAGAALTLASAPAAFAQDDPTTPVETTATSESTDPPAPATSDSSTSETTTGDASTPASAPAPSTTGAIETPAGPEVQTTEGRRAPAAAKPRAAEESEGSETDQDAAETTDTSAPTDSYTNNAGHGFVGLGGEGVLVIACASGAPGNVATVGLTVTAGPDQDGADGRYWNYDVRVVDGFTGTTAPFSWTCDGQEGHGDVSFEQVTPPTSDTSETPTTSDTTTSASSPPGSTSTPDTTQTTPAPVLTRPAVQVRYAPQGGVETGFGGTARFWF
ncbi:hypothetical protein AB0F91_16980 [Amycolatopsis sp. NPDC023774]|uniref:hypothetical protein n=1 Tax=Amycolatopsis sp. NPDC023774 TaxID=3155015 RepID=UPI0033F678BB